MNSNRLILLFASGLLLFSTASVGLAAADGPPCSGSGIIGVVDNTTIDSQEKLYPGTVIDIGRCNNGNVTGFDAGTLEHHPGYTIEANNGGDLATMRITGNAYPVNFSSLAGERNSSLVVNSPSAMAQSSIMGPLSFKNSEQANRFTSNEGEFLAAADAYRNASENLMAKSSEIDGSTELTPSAVSSGNDAIRQLRRAREWMNENRTDLIALSRRSHSTEIRAVVASEITAEQLNVTTSGPDATAAYTNALSARRSTLSSTILTYFGGGALGGLIVGLLVGAALPLKQARNIEEQLRLTRNVEFNRLVALLPILLGLAVFVGGIVLFWSIGGLTLLGVLL